MLCWTDAFCQEGGKHGRVTGDIYIYIYFILYIKDDLLYII